MNRPPSCAAVAHRIGIPTHRWPGNCYGIAQACVWKRVVRGRLCYGMWLGPVAAGSPFAGRALSRHGWVERPDGQVWDPTRWVFEAAKPYIYVGPSDHYDFGMNRVRGLLRGAPPGPGKAELTLELPVSAAVLVGPILALKPEDFEIDARRRTYVHLTRVQVFYLANTPLHDLSEQAKPIFRAIVAAGCDVMIPMDNRERVLGKGRR